MVTLLVRHKVGDYHRWKDVFDSHLTAQQRAGLTIKHVLRYVDDENEVVLWFEVFDVEKAKAFVSSADVPDAQCQSGVVDKPDLLFLIPVN